jgi:hypothetical protein
LRCGLSVYHWKIVTYLATFAALTHLATLTALRGFFARNHQKRTVRMWFMGTLLVLQLTAIVPAGLPMPPSSYMICIFTEEADWTGDEDTETFLLIPLLLFSFLVRVLKLHPERNHGKLRRLVRWITRGVQKLIRRISLLSPHRDRVRKRDIWWYMTFVQPSTAAFYVILMYFDMYLSTTAEVSIPVSVCLGSLIDCLSSFKVFWIGVSLGWITRTIFDERATSSPGNESDWAYGQIISLVVLIGPIMAICEPFFGLFKRSKHSGKFRTMFGSAYYTISKSGL